MFRILQGTPKKELLWGLWVDSAPEILKVETWQQTEQLPSLVTSSKSRLALPMSYEHLDPKALNLKP